MRFMMRLPRTQAGLSIVELLVGIAVGLFVLAGATLLTSNQLTDNRRLLLETQLQQDIRAAMDIIVRDIRRSGYWGSAYQSVGPEATAQQNPYSPAGALSSASDSLSYTVSHNDEANTYDTGALEGNEYNGFAFNSTNHTIDVQLGESNFQALTDPAVVRVTRFATLVSTTPLDLPVCSTPPCAMTTAATAENAACGGIARVMVRNVTVVIEAQAVHDSSVRRSMSSTVRLRNDQVCQ